MEERNTSSGTNTILIVILLLVVVALGVWVVMRGGLGSRAPEQGINVDLQVPAPSGGDGTPQSGTQY